MSAPSVPQEQQQQVPPPAPAPQGAQPPAVPQDPNQEPEVTRNLIVNYIPTTIDETQLRQIFEAYGPTEGVKIVVDRETHASKGFGFIKYARAASAAQAIQYLNGYTLLNKRLKVAYANHHTSGGNVGSGHGAGYRHNNGGFQKGAGGHPGGHPGGFGGGRGYGGPRHNGGGYGGPRGGAGGAPPPGPFGVVGPQGAAPGPQGGIFGAPGGNPEHVQYMQQIAMQHVLASQQRQ